MALSNVIYGSEGDQFTGTAAAPGHDSAQHPLGSRLVLPDGREFRYVKNGAVAMVAGKLYQRKVPGANYDELAVAVAAAAGDTTIEVTNGATTIAANLFDEGFINIEDDAGEGRAYQIASHDAETVGSAQFSVNLMSPKGVREAITTSTTVGLTESKWAGVIIHLSPPTSSCVGVAVDDIQASYFGYVQTKGPCSVLGDGTLIAGAGVMPSDSVDGAVEAWVPETDTAGEVEAMGPIGFCMEVAADTEYSLIDLNLP